MSATIHLVINTGKQEYPIESIGDFMAHSLLSQAFRTEDWMVIEGMDCASAMTVIAAAWVNMAEHPELYIDVLTEGKLVIGKSTYERNKELLSKLVTLCAQHPKCKISISK